MNTEQWNRIRQSRIRNVGHILNERCMDKGYFYKLVVDYDDEFNQYLVMCQRCGARFWTSQRWRVICSKSKCIDSVGVNHEKPLLLPFSYEKPEKRKPPKRAAKEKTAKQKPPAPIKEAIGYVYLMKAENGYHKIGRAKNIEARLDGLNRSIHINVEVIHYFASKNYIATEKKLHEMYKDERVKYEWFNLSEEQVSHICSLQDYCMG